MEHFETKWNKILHPTGGAGSDGDLRWSLKKCNTLQRNATLLKVRGFVAFGVMRGELSGYGGTGDGTRRAVLHRKSSD
jgi:hypothetical protein